MRDDDKTDLPGWLGLKRTPDFDKARWLGSALSVVVIVLFGMAVLVVFAVLGHALFGLGMEDVPRIGFGTGAVAVALIGAPFVIWRSVVAQKTVSLQEQGHITDRINTAVQGLGAEKEVNRIGRPVTIWTGKPKKITHLVEDTEKFEIPPRSVEINRYWDVTDLENAPPNNEAFEGTHVEVTTWPKEKTIIEWQGQNREIEKTEHLGSVGDWQPFPETQHNLEVRIGAIYALERIAQDSDRDHVQIMEILCAYIRQNAPAPAEDDWPKLENGPPEADWGERLKTFREEQNEKKAALKLREDIQVALTVIGRRSPKQRRLEAGRGVEAVFPFDTPCPEYDGPDEGHDRAALVAYREKLDAWEKPLRDYAGFRLDLRHADLRGADLSGAGLKGARLGNTYLQGADMRGARLQGAFLVEARLQGASLREARLQGAVLVAARLQGAHLGEVQLQGTHLMAARLQGANLWKARLQWAGLGKARLQGATLLKARLQGAHLREARLQGASLVEARLQGAFLMEAWLQGTHLMAARLQGANLWKARLQGARLWGARLDTDTDLTAATLRGAAVWSVDCTNIPQIAAHVADMFGDATVTLPGGHGPEHKSWPAHWPNFEMDISDFDDQWREWQRDPDG